MDDFAGRLIRMQAEDEKALEPKQRYWFDFASNKMASYQKQYGESFSLIIAGDENVANDYYAIPFPEVSHIFSDPFLSVDENGTRRRWVGAIDFARLKVTRFPNRISLLLLMRVVQTCKFF